MPTRLIREAMLDSHRYASLGDPAKLLFIHVLLIADDFGCVSVSPTFLRRRAFYNSPSNEQIAKLLSELADADLIRLYEHDGGHYGFIPRFRQRLQRDTLKHPQPPQALFKDDSAVEKFNKINEVSKKATVVQPLSTVLQPPDVDVDVDVDVDGEVEKLHKTFKPLSGSKTARPQNSVETWNAYSQAYTERYGIPPTRNATVNGQLSRFVSRIGAAEAPLVAAFYLTHQDAYYVKKMHPAGMLLADAEKLRTEWATRKQMTGVKARQIERKAGTGDAARQLIEEIRNAKS